MRVSSTVTIIKSGTATMPTETTQNKFRRLRRAATTVQLMVLGDRHGFLALYASTFQGGSRFCRFHPHALTTRAPIGFSPAPTVSSDHQTGEGDHQVLQVRASLIFIPPPGIVKPFRSPHATLDDSSTQNGCIFTLPSGTVPTVNAPLAFPDLLCLMQASRYVVEVAQQYLEQPRAWRPI